MKRVLPAIDELRSMVKYFNSQHEGHNAQFSHVELLKIWKFATLAEESLYHCARAYARLAELADK